MIYVKPNACFNDRVYMDSIGRCPPMIDRDVRACRVY